MQRNDNSRLQGIFRPTVLAQIIGTSLTLVVAAGSHVLAETVPWPDIPLFMGLNVPPNIVLAIDDSGSMDGEILLNTNDGMAWWHTGLKSFVGLDINDMSSLGSINYNATGAGNDTWQKYFYLFPNGTGTGNREYGDNQDKPTAYAVPPLPQFAFLRSSHYNGVYYDPMVTYTPWPETYGATFANANPANAPSDPARGGNYINLIKDLASEETNWRFMVQPGMKYINGNTVETYKIKESKSIKYFPATYYYPTIPKPNTPYNNGQSNCKTPSPEDYKAFEANPLISLPEGVHSIGPDGTCLTRYEIKPGNTYPSGRTYEQEIQNFANWFSYYRKRHLVTRGAILRAFLNIRGFNLSTFAFNKRPTSLNFYPYPGTPGTTGVETGKKTLYDDVKNYVGNGGTPTRESLNHIGTQLARTTNSPLQHVCQKNYGIIFTDGFANNSTVVGIGNEDGTAGTPYADTWSGTLADIAMKYYKKLRDGGSVPSTYGCGLGGAPGWLDCNTEWHLNTFAVTLGTLGTIFGKTHQSREDVYSNPPVWPEPNVLRSPRMVDDLFHATINGRGEMLNAKSGAELDAKLHHVINTILKLSASGAGATVNTRRISSDATVFYTTFESGTWTGDIIAYPVSLDGVQTLTPRWKASEKVPLPSARRIYTRSSQNGPIPFLWSSLSVDDQSALESADIVNYIRGAREKEKQYGGSLRNRPINNILGDIAHATPLYLKENDTVFVGANDGMLHAFDAKTGIERFAYIPSSLLPRLKTLTSDDYQHKYFVDGEATVSSRLDTNGKNILVSTLGRGGKGLFALDVTSPAEFSGAHVMWEYFASNDDDMGYILGKPVIARLNDDTMAVITGNGYASVSGAAALYIFRLEDGRLLKKLTTSVSGSNGLSTPSVLDTNNDGKIDFIYAGDLKGNIWRIDVSSNQPSQWRFKDRQSNTPKPFFTAKDNNGNLQPITAPIGIALNSLQGTKGYGKWFLLFGTGSYFRTGDGSDKSQQSWYGIIDDDGVVNSRSELISRTVEQTGFFDGKPVRVFPAGTGGDMNDKYGWFLDFPGATGERVVTQTFYVDNGVVPFAVVSSIIPSENPCVPGGRGYLNFINPFTGTRLSDGVADINKNNNFDDDKLNGLYIGSVDLGVGMPGAPSITEGRVVVPGTTGIESVKLRLTQKKLGRLGWREIVR